MPRHRRGLRNLNWPLLSVLLAIATACAAYVLPALIASSNSDYAPHELIVPRLLDLFAIGWFFWFGASVGSFLNVVAWRMPRGRSINGSSACPFCNTGIKAYDNIPVFGWLKLRGRCRACQLPFSPRYAIVEAIVGISIMMVGVLGLYSGGANLPYAKSPPQESGPLDVPNISLEIVAINAYHIMALIGAWALALVRFDGFGLPRRLVYFFLVCAIAPILAWQPLQQVPWQLTTAARTDEPSFLSTLFYVLAGIVAACMIARAIGRYTCPAADPKMDPLGKDTSRLIDLIFMLLLPAIVLGWQASIAISMMAVVAAVGLKRFFQKRDGFEWLAIGIPIAMTIHLAYWKQLFAVAYWPAPDHSPWVFLAWIGGILIFSAALRTKTESKSQPNLSAIGNPSDEHHTH